MKTALINSIEDCCSSMQKERHCEVLMGPFEDRQAHYCSRPATAELLVKCLKNVTFEASSQFPPLIACIKKALLILCDAKTNG